MADGWASRFYGLRRWTLLAGALLAIVVLVGGGLAIYAARALSRFERVEARRSTVLYAAPPVLRPGVNVTALDLAGILGRQGYRETRNAGAPGQFSRSEGAWEINVAGAARVSLGVSGGRITHLRQGDSAVQSVVLPPELLASAGADMGENIRPVRLPDVPQLLREAVLVTEDVRFYEHGGVDPRGIVRALWTNVRKGRVAEGGSTITQQLVKSRLLNPERTLARKINEALLSTALEWRYSKDQILEAYLNEIYLGQSGGSAVRGVGAASRAYFGKEVHQLSLTESALLAGMIRGPNNYSPVANPERARERRDVVLGRMRGLGKISEADYQRRPQGAGAGADDAGERADGALLRGLRARRARAKCRHRPGRPARGARLHHARSGLAAPRRGRGGEGHGPSGDAASAAAAQEPGGAPAGGDDRARPRHRTGPRARRRPRLPGEPVQPGRPRPPPAGQRVQAVRVPGRDHAAEGRDPLHARLADRGRAHHGDGGRQAVDAQELRRPLPGAGHGAPTRSRAR